MKQIIFLYALTSAIFATEVELVFQPYQLKSTLSKQQTFQLQFLKNQLQEYATQIQKLWTTNINARLIIEDAELAVQQSSIDTQQAMKQSIINIFQAFNIDIYFTNDNLIRRIKHKIYPLHYDLEERKNHTAHFNTHTPHQNSAKPPKIKGAQKTFKKLQQKRLEYEAKKRQEWLNSIKLEEQKRLQEAAEQVKQQQEALLEHYRIQYQEQLQQKNMPKDDDQENDENE